jgi:pilin isopeptide linkage protein
MKKGKKLNTASALSAVLMAGAIMNAVPAFAATTPVAGTTTTFDKYLVMKKNANVPNATFSYKVSIPTDDEMRSLPNPEDTNGTNLTVRKGIGAPTVSSTTFAAGDQTFDSAQKSRTNKSSSTYDAAEDDQVTLDKDHKYAKHTSTVDFSKVTFSEPGVYRYKITENDTSEKGITKDSTSRYLDVYVESAENGTLSIKGYVFHTMNEVQPKGNKDSLGSNNPEGKNKGFENKYETIDLTLTKNVTGNQGFRDQYFKFHVDITDLDGGARLFLTDKDGNKPYKSIDTVAYEYDKETGTRKAGQKRFFAQTGTFTDVTAAQGSDADMSGLALTANDSGNASFDVYLKHGESLKINGLTKDAKYTVKETSEDYSASATKNDQAIDLTHNKDDHTDATATQTLAGDETVAYTNKREGTLPTGIYHNNRAAFNIMGIAAAGGAIAIVIRKRRKSTEQAQKKIK